jgi:hypothetical protein
MCQKWYCSRPGALRSPKDFSLALGHELLTLQRSGLLEDVRGDFGITAPA